MRKCNLHLGMLVLLVTGGLGAAAGLLTGCGANGSSQSIIPSAGRGSAVFRVQWPVRESGASRLIPKASSSLRFKVFEMRADNDDEPKLITEKVVPRPPDGPDGLPPSSTVRLASLPPVKVKIEISALPTAEGTGTAQASGTLEMNIEESRETTQAVTLASTIAEIRITPDPAEIGFETLKVFTAAAYDLSGALVLVSPGNWEWLIADTSIIESRETNGDKITIIGKRGEASTELIARDKESSKTGRAVVKVNNVFRVAPLNSRVHIGESVYLYSVFNNRPEEADWTTTGGALSEAGRASIVVFNAQNVGEYTITAVSRVDRSRKATATVAVDWYDASKIIGTSSGRLKTVYDNFYYGDHIEREYGIEITVANWDREAETVSVTWVLTPPMGSKIPLGPVTATLRADNTIPFAPLYDVPGSLFGTGVGVYGSGSRTGPATLETWTIPETIKK